MRRTEMCCWTCINIPIWDDRFTITTSGFFTTATTICSTVSWPRNALCAGSRSLIHACKHDIRPEEGKPSVWSPGFSRRDVGNFDDCEMLKLAQNMTCAPAKAGTPYVEQAENPCGFCHEAVR